MPFPYCSPRSRGADPKQHGPTYPNPVIRSAMLHDPDIAPEAHDLQWTPAGQASSTYFVRIGTPSEARMLPVTVVR